jgi:hypothetical protein
VRTHSNSASFNKASELAGVLAGEFCLFVLEAANANIRHGEDEEVYIHFRFTEVSLGNTFARVLFRIFCNFKLL